MSFAVAAFVALAASFALRSSLCAVKSSGSSPRGFGVFSNNFGFFVTASTTSNESSLSFFSAINLRAAFAGDTSDRTWGIIFKAAVTHDT
jgi:hypothetical protein